MPMNGRTDHILLGAEDPIGPSRTFQQQVGPLMPDLCISRSRRLVLGPDYQKFLSR